MGADNIHEPCNSTIKILEKIQVSPPPGSVPPTKLPLTFFDIPWLMFVPTQRLLFYQLPHPTQHFTHTILPNLKHSLSLALRHFFPFAATLILPPPPHKSPYLLYEEGSSVSLTVAESSGDFNRLISNVAQDVKNLRPFVPQLPPSSENELKHIVGHVLALQITVFPNSGICVGYTLNHCIGDGKTISRFMKSWASICKMPTASFNETLVEYAPSYNRDAIVGSDDVQESSLESLYSLAWNMRHNGHIDLSLLEDKVRATFVISRTHINKLKNWVLDQFTTCKETHALNASSFVVICAFTWVHLIKVQPIGLEDDDKTCNLVFPADCRNRKVFPFPIPATYFGNCLEMCIVRSKRSELVGNHGLFAAAKAIATRVKELGSGEKLGGFNKYVSQWNELGQLDDQFGIFGSPNLRSYEIDFGLGGPKKSEIVHIDNFKAISLEESREEEGGVEIGVALHKDMMEKFTISFYEDLKVFMN